MHLLKHSVLSLFISTALFGCGADSDNDNNTTAVKKLTTLSFINFQNISKYKKSSCTNFLQEEFKDPNNTQYLYANIAYDVRVNIYDAQGIFQQNLKVTKKGRLSFDKAIIPNNGYLSIIDSPSNSDPYYKVLSIQKALVSDLLIEIGRNSGSPTCYTETANKQEIKTKHLSFIPKEIAVNSYSFNSQSASIIKQISPKQEVTHYVNEAILIRAYNTDILSDYLFVEKSTSSPVESANNTLFPYSINQITTPITITIKHGQYSYPWDSLSVAALSQDIQISPNELKKW